MKKIILASSSAYRHSLLKRLKLDFSSAIPGIDESPLVDESAEQLVKRLSLAKARKIARQFPKSLIIGSDQAVVLGNTLLGKPGTVCKAIEQLRKASGKTVHLVTGLCLLNSNTGAYQLDSVEYQVEMRTLSDSQIKRYVHLDHPLDCAGSFKWESLGIALFERMQGDDVSSLEGLPLILLTSMLANEGIHVL